MATRFTIAREMQDGTIQSIYGHWDGYPDGAGATLQHSYTDERKIEKLIDLGDLSVLDDDLGEKHNFENRPEGHSSFYGRDRGETGIDAMTHTSVTDWLRFRRGSYCEWGYLWDGVRWNTYKITENI